VLSGEDAGAITLSPAAWIVSFLLPMTYGVEGLQDMMLSGIAPHPVIWLGLSIITVVTFGLDWFLTWRAFRQA